MISVFLQHNSVTTTQGRHGSFRLEHFGVNATDLESLTFGLVHCFVVPSRIGGSQVTGWSAPMTAAAPLVKGIHDTNEDSQPIAFTVRVLPSALSLQTSGAGV